ncbi:MAG: biotin/lipoyl-binding protein [Ignavibacteria bacterium]|nr:biotin/lipoyl-binding protein [Ignavibacteria bacterium]
MKIFFFLFVVFLFTSCSNNHSGQLESTGTLEATDVNVSAKTSGQLQKLFFEEGNNIKENDTLAILDYSTQDLQLAHAEAGIELAQSQYDLLLNGTRSECYLSAVMIGVRLRNFQNHKFTS